MESYIDLRKMAKNEDFVLNHKEKVSSKNAMDDRKKENSKYAFSDAQKRYLPLKRAFDILISSVALIVCLPLFFVIAFLIKIDSKGRSFLSNHELVKTANCLQYISLEQCILKLLKRWQRQSW